MKNERILEPDFSGTTKKPCQTRNVSSRDLYASFRLISGLSRDICNASKVKSLQSNPGLLFQFCPWWYRTGPNVLQHWSMAVNALVFVWRGVGQFVQRSWLYSQNIRFCTPHYYAASSEPST